LGNKNALRNSLSRKTLSSGRTKIRTEVLKSFQGRDLRTGPDLVTDTRPEFTEEIDRRDEQEHWLRAIFARCEELGPRHRAVLMARAQGMKLGRSAGTRKSFSPPLARSGSGKSRAKRSNSSGRAFW